MEIEAIKSARSARKRKVTVLIGKLKASLQYGKDNSGELKSSLEEEMDSLLDLDLQVAEIEGDNNYLESVLPKYHEIIDSFHASEKEDAEIVKKKEISSLSKTIDRTLVNIVGVSDRANYTLSLTKLSQEDVVGLEVDNKILTEEVSHLMAKVSSLGELTDIGRLESRVDEVLRSTEQVKRDSAVRLRMISSGSPSAVSGEGSPTLRKVFFPPTTSPPPPTSLPVLFPPTTTSPPLTSLSPEAHSFTPSLAHSIASLSLGTGTQTQPSTSVVWVSGTQGEAGKFLPPISSLSAPIYHLSGYSSAYACASGIQGSLGGNTLPSMSSGHISHTIPSSSPAPFHHLSGPPSANAWASLGRNTLPSMCSGHIYHSVPYTMTVPSTPLPGYTTSAAHALGMQGNSPLYGMGPYTSGTSLGTGPFSQNLGHFQGPFIPGPLPRPDLIHTKRPSLPYFSGDRADWPEFRCVWRSMAESQFSNKVTLAMELKRCCKGKAAERVRHIYVTNDNAYEEIWERLREEYDDPGLSSQEAISRLRSLKPVRDQDYAGLVKVIDTVDSIFNQLRELGQLNAVHSVDVDSVSACLPGTTHMEWLRRYSELPSVEKMAPFGAFVAFLRRERTAVARLAETTPMHGRSVRSSSNLGQGTDRGKSSQQGKVKACAVHPDGQHLTKDCAEFLGMSVPQRYDCLKRSKRCFNCFGAHHRDQCSAPCCSVCGRRHHRLLCSASPSGVESPETATGGQ